MAHQIFSEQLMMAVAELQAIDNAVRVCEYAKACSCKPVVGTGYPQADIFAIKDMPGEDEMETGLAFSSKAGRALVSICIALLIEPSFVYATNAFKCTGPVGREKDVCRVHCGKLLQRELYAVDPKLIWAFGERSAQLLGLDYAPGQSIQISPDRQILMTLDLDEAIKNKGAKQEVWRHLKHN